MIRRQPRHSRGHMASTTVASAHSPRHSSSSNPAQNGASTAVPHPAVAVVMVVVVVVAGAAVGRVVGCAVQPAPDAYSSVVVISPHAHSAVSDAHPHSLEAAQSRTQLNWPQSMVGALEGADNVGATEGPMDPPPMSRPQHLVAQSRAYEGLAHHCIGWKSQASTRLGSQLWLTSTASSGRARPQHLLGQSLVYHGLLWQSATACVSHSRNRSGAHICPLAADSPQITNSWATIVRDLEGRCFQIMGTGSRTAAGGESILPGTRLVRAQHGYSAKAPTHSLFACLTKPRPKAVLGRGEACTSEGQGVADQNLSQTPN